MGYNGVPKLFILQQRTKPDFLTKILVSSMLFNKLLKII